MAYLADKKVLVLVADAARARIFAANEDAQTLVEIEALVNANAHLRGADLQTDRAGRSFDSRGDGRHAMASSTDVKTQAANEFAREVAHRFNQLAADKDYVNLALVAAPAFLGQLRKNLDANTRRKTGCEINKDLTGYTAREIDRTVTKAMRGH